MRIPSDRICYLLILTPWAVDLGGEVMYDMYCHIRDVEKMRGRL